MTENKIYKIVAKSTLIILLIILGVMLLIKGFKVLLLILGAVLMATYFLGITHFLESKLPIKRSVALIGTVVVTFGIIALLMVTVFPNFSEEVVTLKETIPEATDKIREQIDSNEALDYILNPIITSFEIERSNTNGYVATFFSSIFGVAGDFYIMLFLGFLILAQPSIYINGFISLFPKKNRERLDEVLALLGKTLRNWLLGKLLSMLIVGVLTSIGLYIIGAPLPLTLAIIAALLAFIPNIGPLLALIPALLVTFSVSPQLALTTLIIYMVVQTIESNFITPFIHRKLISMPMAMVLIAQVLLAIFTGYLGLIFAVPIVAIVMVLIKTYYLQDVLKEKNITI
ncbi:MAG TPA: AI-2E family transporter [Flavobacteriaceae bacterium]|nr:AI-2E family transporter [Flavobacteriaceae bacterium]